MSEQDREPDKQQNLDDANDSDNHPEAAALSEDAELLKQTGERFHAMNAQARAKLVQAKKKRNSNQVAHVILISFLVLGFVNLIAQNSHHTSAYTPPSSSTPSTTPSYAPPSTSTPSHYSSTPSYTPTSNSTPSYYSSTSSSYAASAPAGLSYTSSADRTGVGALYATRDSLKSHDYAGAARNADACLDAARRTGDPEAIEGAQVLRDAVRRTTGY